MDLTIYDVILGPVFSEKAATLNRDLKKIVLKVHPAANKTMIKAAMWKIFQVKVEKVNTKNRQKDRKSGRRVIHGPQVKTAMITLAKGYNLDLLGQAGIGESMPDASGTTDKD